MIKTTYKGLNIELSKDGRSYVAYEITPILKNRCEAFCGSSSEMGTYNLDYIKRVIDEGLEGIEDEK